MLGAFSKFHYAGRHAAPFVITLFLQLLCMVPLQLKGFGSIAPSIALMGIFFWTVYRPDLMGPLAAFTLGLVQDAISGAPLGMNASIALLTYATVLSQRQLFLAHSFPVLWWGYGMIAIGAGLIAWSGYSLAVWQVLPIGPMVFHTLSGIALFVPVAWLFGLVHAAFVSEG
jgi:rod shape-determining protein MreD